MPYHWKHYCVCQHLNQNPGARNARLSPLTLLTFGVKRSLPNHMQTRISNCPQLRKNVNVHPRSQFVFTSDRDEGLKPALKEVFPFHDEMSCVKHIEANVTTKFGRKCGKHVMAMAKRTLFVIMTHFSNRCIQQRQAQHCTLKI